MQTLETRKLKGTELDVSRICFGTMTFGSQVDLSEAKAMVDTCLEKGINFLDTANAYNGGRSEDMLGTLLKGRRDQVVLASKVFNRMRDGPEDQGLSRNAIARAVDESLRRLQTEYLDIYYMHAPDYNVQLEETMEAMDELVRQGKIRYIGASNYASWQLCRLHSIAESAGLATVPVSQPMYNLIARGIEQEFLPACEELDVATIVYNPLAGGLLTGKHQRHTTIPGTRFDSNEQYQNRYWHDANFEAVDHLSEIARGSKRTLISLALNWLLHHSASDCLILGASCADQLVQNVNVCEDGPLSDDVVKACDEVWKTLRGVTPIYNR